MKASEIDKLTRDVIEKQVLENILFIAQVMELDLIFMNSFINSKSDVIIEDNMVFTIEPGILSSKWIWS